MRADQITNFDYLDPKRVLPIHYLIIDQVNSKYLIDLIDQDDRYYIFQVNPMKLPINITIVKLFLLKILIRIKTTSNVKFSLHEIKLDYLISIVEFIDPKAVLTFIDNSNIFSLISKACKNIPCIAIQNGARLSYCKDESPNYHAQHLFCFGNHEPILFEKIGYLVNNYYPVGSLLADKFYIKKEKQAIKYDFLIVSCWRGNIVFSDEVKETMIAMKKMDIFLSNFLHKNGYSGAIIFRSKRNGADWFMPEIGCNEEEYFRSIYHDGVTYIDNVPELRNVYEAISSSAFIVSFLSTALLEAYGFGKKALYLNFLETNRYHCDYEDKIVMNCSDPPLDSKRLKEIYEMDLEEYSKLHHEYQRRIMKYPEGLSTSKYIEKKILEIVNAD